MPRDFSAQTRTELLGERIKTYPHPCDPDVLITIRSSSAGRMNRYGRLVDQAGAQLKTETYKLIRDSVIDKDSHEPVFSQEDVSQMGGFDCQFITGLIQLIGFHNGQSKTDIEELVGNFEETE